MNKREPEKPALDISKMSKDDLIKHLEEIRARRRTGYSAKTRKASRTSLPAEYAGLTADIAEKILKELEEGGMTDE